jgi:hypothetical protein
MIMNPRRIPESMDALGALNIDKVWLRNWTEQELVRVIPEVIRDSDHDPIGMISDDCIPTQEALDLVLDAYEPGAVYTGYSNLDDATDVVNLCDAPLVIQEEATPECYPMVTRAHVEAQPDALMRSYFAGFSFTFMSREMWERYPFAAYGHPGCQSDYQLCKRLQADGVKIFAVRGAFILHLRGGNLSTGHLEGGNVVAGGDQGSVGWDFRELPS